ncbi:hypothetical protein Z043_113770 [Scleropages formosus]|uniref:CULT domain-containing protein n=1 Tax=Scleropages formosus TaxID=113540 RepID=A0A0P7UHA7_SCLFO|nr:hypothetical protein Z043_113770 [Scleropages formosus]
MTRAACRSVNAPALGCVLVWLSCLLAPCRPCGAPGRSDLLLCRSCGHEVALGSAASFVESRVALSHRNVTALGGRRVPVQLFENPQGFRFEVVTFRAARVRKHWPADARFTWYPGFSWAVATCPQCSAHLGWAFQPSDWPETVTERRFEESNKTFVALIVDSLLPENFASTLLMTPKSFRS